MPHHGVAYIPLFDRLTDLHPDSPDETPIASTLDDAGLCRSVKIELQNILETRYVQTVDAEDGERPDAYGIPETLVFSPHMPEGWHTIKQILSQAIQKYEPRIVALDIDMGSYDRQTQTLAITISGTLMTGKLLPPLNFPLSVKKVYETPNHQAKVANL